MIVGIDLGTTNSLCAVFGSGAPRLIKSAHGSVLTPSVVGILDDGQVLVGQSAKKCVSLARIDVPVDLSN